MSEVVRYFRNQAPMELVLPETRNATGSAVHWQRHDVPDVPATVQERLPPAVSFLGLTGDHPAGSRLLISDMQGSTVQLLDAAEALSPHVMVRLAHPAAVCSCDLDGDGREELLEADLGSFLPEDHDRGGVFWLPDGGVLEAVPRSNCCRGWDAWRTSRSATSTATDVKTSSSLSSAGIKRGAFG